MPKLVATKAFRLSGGRSFQPGDELEVRTTAEARALVAIGRARNADVEGAAAPAQADPDLDVLRQQAESYGIAVDGRWRAARLQDEIAAVQRRRQEAAAGTYSRRDMVAEEPLRPYTPSAAPAEPEPAPSEPTKPE